jgi:fructose-1,6-bisphosphatase/inositol monophosphatase family enzyme
MSLVAFDPIAVAVPSPFSPFSDRATETAISAARRAGAIQLHHFRNTAVRCTRLLHDVKLETDRLCEGAIIAAIRERFPDLAILTEESGRLPGSGEYTWIIDPLDGTVNFWHGLPFFCVSIACYRSGGPTAQEGGTRAGLPGVPVVGVVFLPFSQELFVGTPGRGAFLNGRPISVSNSERCSDVVVTVSFGKTPEMMQRMTRRLDVLLPQVRKARCLGAVAAELAYVGAGFLGGLVYEGIKLWDFAAGKIIVEEAGGFLEAAETEPDQWRVLAGAPVIRDSLKPALEL